jgi:hypothetical protein
MNDATTLVFVPAIVTVLLLGILAVRSLTASSRMRSATAMEPPFNLRAFHNLLSAEEDAFVRLRLSKKDYNRLQRKKYRVALAYISDLSCYAAGIARLGQASRRSSDSQVVAAADALVSAAFRLRLTATIVRLNLGIWLLFPSSQLSLPRLVHHYQRIQDAAALLGVARYRLASVHSGDCLR